jgi:hypothetical protein
MLITLTLFVLLTISFVLHIIHSTYIEFVFSTWILFGTLVFSGIPWYIEIFKLYIDTFGGIDLSQVRYTALGFMISIVLIVFFINKSHD